MLVKPGANATAMMIAAAASPHVQSDDFAVGMADGSHLILPMKEGSGQRSIVGFSSPPDSRPAS